MKIKLVHVLSILVVLLVFSAGVMLVELGEANSDFILLKDKYNETISENENLKESLEAKKQLTHELRERIVDSDKFRKELEDQRSKSDYLKNRVDSLESKLEELNRIDYNDELFLQFAPSALGFSNLVYGESYEGVQELFADHFEFKQREDKVSIESNTNYSSSSVYFNSAVVSRKELVNFEYDETQVKFTYSFSFDSKNSDEVLSGHYINIYFYRDDNDVLIDYIETDV